MNADPQPCLEYYLFTVRMTGFIPGMADQKVCYSNHLSSRVWPICSPFFFGQFFPLLYRGGYDRRDERGGGGGYDRRDERRDYGRRDDRGYERNDRSHIFIFYLLCFSELVILRASFGQMQCCEIPIRFRALFGICQLESESFLYYNVWMTIFSMTHDRIRLRVIN